MNTRKAAQSAVCNVQFFAEDVFGWFPCVALRWEAAPTNEVLEDSPTAPLAPSLTKNALRCVDYALVL